MTNYRPVSVLPAVSKVFEKIMHTQICTYVESNKILHAHQYGFRKQHSTELAALHLTDKILDNMDNGLKTIAIFSDLSKAFDTIDHEILIQKLKHYGMSNSALNLIMSYLNDRKQFVDFSGTYSSYCTISTGVPQGSILGPLLFILYINDLPFITNNLESILYADDGTFLLTPSKTDPDAEISQAVNNELTLLSEWFKANKLALNTDKTKYMIFHRPACKPRNLNLTINSIHIERVNNFKFLGLQINEHLTWADHVNHVSLKISRAIGILNKIKFQVPQHILLTIYHSLVMSHCNFHLVIWGHNCASIFKLQKKAIRIITHSHFQSHTSLLFRKLKLLTLPDLYSLAILKYYYSYVHQTLPLYHLSLNIYPNAAYHSYNTRNRYNLTIPIIRHHFATKSIRHSVTTLINSLPQNISEKNSYSQLACSYSVLQKPHPWTV